ncbi:hypothetical protein [Limosilactobacillus mucosae]|uniref:hypothetical protein n=1 Tax=uncultured Limosilactobacillus sp. TaxID=2837629 RepID=UPI00242C6779|nr:hypothetical protein [Limosilactobacillus mucosae]
MNLYRVTLNAWLCNLVVAASERQAAGLIADEFNRHWRQTGITFQWSDFDVNKIDIDSFRQPTIID